MLIHDELDRWAAETPDAPALWFDDECWTFAELAAEVHRAAAGLAATLLPGAPIAMISDNRPELVIALYAAPLAGHPLLLVNTRLTETEQQALLDEVEPVAVFRAVADGPGADWHALVDVARSIVDVTVTRPQPNDLAWIIHTSGTTGRPKGARLTHASLGSAVDVTASCRPFADDDVYLFPFPLFHVAAYNVLHAHRRGRPVVLLRRFDADAVLDQSTRRGVTTMSLAPTMILMLLDHPSRRRGDLATLRTIAYGASAISPDLMRRTVEELTCDLTQGYGMTELSGNAVFLDVAAHRRALSDQPELLRAAGRPGPGVELRLVGDDGHPVAHDEIGEIAIRGRQVCDGYWNAPEASASTFVDGWIHTGDVGRLDDGMLYVVDRKKDLVISGGENVSSREVEETVCAHPDIGSVAVIGYPHPRWGEIVTAVVVPASGSTVDPDEIIEWCRGRIAGFKRPRRVLVIDELPLTASGKVRKPDLRAWAADQAPT